MPLGFPIGSRHLLGRWDSMRMWLLMFLGYLVAKRSAQSPTSLRVGRDCIRTQSCGGSHRHPSDGLHGVTMFLMNREEYEGKEIVQSEDGGNMSKEISDMDAVHRDTGLQSLLTLSFTPGVRGVLIIEANHLQCLHRHRSNPKPRAGHSVNIPKTHASPKADAKFGESRHHR